MQSYEVPMREALFLERSNNELRRQLTDRGTVEVKEVYTGDRKAEVYKQMETRVDRLEAMGFSVNNLHRAKIGRNSFCPCGSQRKFKKCCIGKVKSLG